MFEKEADEYRKNRKEQLINDDEFELLDNFDLNVGIAFKDGAEFGYNKANEWHKVSEEGLPPNKPGGTLYLLWTVRGSAGSPVVADYFRKDKDEMHNIWTGATLTKEDVVSWKEIELPTE